MAKKSKELDLRDDEIRQLMLQFFFDRNSRATSRRGKKTGAAVPISIMRAELKDKHGLSMRQVQSNLTYLLSQGWVEDQPISKTFVTPKGGAVPSPTSYYVITAAGIDKISGPSQFTRDRFRGVKIEATGQNIITLGDGNQVNASFAEIGEALSELREAVRSSTSVPGTAQVELITDIDSLQDQLAKPEPNRKVVSVLWDSIHKAASTSTFVEAVGKVGALLQGLL